MKRIFRKIHLWLSVPFGLIITLVCFSGAMLVFEKELTRLFGDNTYKVERAVGEPLPMHIIVANVEPTLPRGVRITGVTVSHDPEEAYRVNLSKPKHAAVTVDQYTGEVIGRQECTAFFSAMFRLHRWLLDSGRPEGRPAYGKLVVGVSTLMFVVALLSGVALWWPKTRRALRESLKVAVHKGRVRLWRSLHVAGGMYALVLLLAMALTGLTWSFQWYNRAVYAAFGIDAPQRKGGHGSGSKPAVTLDASAWQTVYDRLRADNPEARSITVSDGTASVSHGGFGNTRAADRYTFDTATGRITSATPYADAAPSGKLRGWLYSVHTGTFGGLPTRILWFLASLFGASLPITGYWLWLRRLRKERNKAAAVSAA